MADCGICKHTHVDVCEESVGYDHLNGFHECGCPGLDTLLFDAWEEGFDAGHRFARAVNDEWPEPPPNPYDVEGGDRWQP